MQVCGLVLFGLGFVLYIDRESQLYGQLFHLLPSSGPLIALDKIPAVLAGTGTTILLLSFLGCYGACAESVCFLWLVSQSVSLVVTRRHVGGIVNAKKDSVKMRTSGHSSANLRTSFAVRAFRIPHATVCKRKQESRRYTVRIIPPTWRR